VGVPTIHFMLGKALERECVGGFRMMCVMRDALPSPGLNPLEGLTMLSCGKLGLEGRSRLPALKRGTGAC